MNKKLLTCAALLPLAVLLQTATASDSVTDKKMLERGRYLVAISGCNDCHTPGYAESAGKIPESEWLMGSPVGFKGPWGTSYPANLRISVQTQNEKEWMTHARSPLRPPMPWFALRDMTENDVRAIYRYVRQLGAKGEPAPAFVPPNQVVKTPYIEFVPKNLPSKQANAAP